MSQTTSRIKPVNICSADSPECCVEEVGQTVQHLVRVMQLFERDQIKPHGFTTSQAYVLTQLKQVQELTMNELSEKLNARTSTMTRIVNNLVRDGFIQRKRDNNDRRIVLVGLTTKGEKASALLESDITAYYEKIVSHLPEGRVEEVLRATALLVEAFDKANPNCC
jgi:DNA-binding MarR family transcriptional regulator